MRKKGFTDLGFAKVDVDRFKRRGFPEVVYCPGKTREQIIGIVRELARHKQPLLLTRLEKDAWSGLKKHFPGLEYDPLGKIAYQGKKTTKKRKNPVLLISAGTADIPVAEEAYITLKVMGEKVIKLYDVGVAGSHRLADNLGLLKKASVIIVVAGMEGALASLVSGLVACPVVAVPTSSGYGASFSGLSALLTMINSCSPGVAVVNIDNGFGAGYFASLINR
ncbi:MAG: nickel pincer cofactor biosynthesis protein LarB [Candidatus Omnitrophica bacterium]|nr:nickel pincer cofactor biosynthesis protein LarB [Candidatus Omnitrophota bacterium]MDD5236508.1 nickel pincer cofactor biosynthesis protein LarB [Candidatus Omnitrophota bacterium]MDD5610395.1 nickel pincer cofactor biosynthesis protein LarB [Candidatus Omnitrophota bacterium]